MQKQQNHSPRIVKPWQDLMCKPDQNGSSLTTWHVVADSEGGGELQLTFSAGRLPEGSSANSSTFSGTIPPPPTGHRPREDLQSWLYWSQRHVRSSVTGQAGLGCADSGWAGASGQVGPGWGQAGPRPAPLLGPWPQLWLVPGQNRGRGQGRAHSWGRGQDRGRSQSRGQGRDRCGSAREGPRQLVNTI